MEKQKTLYEEPAVEWYVSRRPDSCLDCPLLDSHSDFPNLWCNLSEECVNGKPENIRCPLKLIKENK